MKIVNIGCNHNKDDAYEFIKTNHKKIEKIFMIDAAKESVEKCKELYKKEVPKAFDKITFFNLAIMENPHFESVKFFMPKDDLGSGFSSVDVNMLAHHGKRKLIEVVVPSITINDFFEQNNIKELDRLYIDTEGLDSGILISLDQLKYDVKYILFEHLHLDGPFNKAGRRMKDLLFYKLRQANYSLKPSGSWNIEAEKILTE